MRGLHILAGVLAALVGATAAHGHASLTGSEPSDRTVVAQAPSALPLTFNEPVSPLVLRLAQPDGVVVDLKGVAARGAVVTVTMPSESQRGTHLLSWRVMSADGHPVGGALTFSVGEPSAASTARANESDKRLRAAIWFARLVLYVGLFVGVGGAFYSCWIALSPPSEWARNAITIAMGCGIAAALISFALQGVDVLGVPFADIRDPHVWGIGLANFYVLTLGLAIVALLLGLASQGVKRQLDRWCAAAALAGVGLALAASGHAATADPAWVIRPAVFLHGLTAAFWIGVLLPLATALRDGQGRSELLRFSRVIPLPLAVLLATGAVLAVIQVRQVAALWTTNYGLILSGKLMAVCALLACAAVNRRLTPRAASGESPSARLLVRSITIELVLVALVLALVASWRFTPPPRSLLAAQAQPIHVHVHKANAMADLRIEPPNATGQRITITLLDGEFRPLAAKEVALTLSKPDAGIEPLRLPATRREDATWQIEGLRLPMSGRWHGRVEILVNDFEKTTIEDELELR
jgi:copper transport protein